jgi:hypothetical protein
MKISISALAAFVLWFCSSAVAQTSYMTEPSLSPDRKEIAFVSGGDIWSVAADGGGVCSSRIRPPEARPLFSPDKRILTCVRLELNGKWRYLHSDIETGAAAANLLTT